MTKLYQLSYALTKLGSINAATKVASFIKSAFTTPDEFRVVFNVLLKGGAGADKVIGPLRHAMRQYKEVADKVIASFPPEKQALILKALSEPASNRSSGMGIDPDTGEPRQPWPGNWQGTNDPSNEDGFWDDDDLDREDDEEEDEQQEDWRIGVLKDSVHAVIAIGTRWLEANYQRISDACKKYGTSFDNVSNDLEAFIAFDTNFPEPTTIKTLNTSEILLPIELFSPLARETRAEIMKIHAENDAKISK